MLAGAVGVYAYDASRDDLIADGVTVGGVNVGGMRAGEARQAIEEQLAAPLREPLVVRYQKQRFRLTRGRGASCTWTPSGWCRRRSTRAARATSSAARSAS